MSAEDERAALHDLPLYAYALHLTRVGGDAPVAPRRPGPVSAPRPRRTGRESVAVARRIVESSAAGADTARAAEELPRRMREEDLKHPHLLRAARESTLTDEARARALARRLTRTGTTWYAVFTGIALLGRVGDAEDVPYLRALAALPDLTHVAVTTLDTLDHIAASAVWLERHCREDDHALRTLNEGLAADDRAAALDWLRTEAPDREVDAEAARRIAQATRLADAVREYPRDPALLAGAARLLVLMTSRRHYVPEILHYRDAVAIQEAVVRGAAALTPSLGHWAVLLGLAQDLRSGPGVLPARPAGQRAHLLAALGALLATPRWQAVLTGPDPDDAAGRHRLDWARRTARMPFAPVPETVPLRIEAAVHDPARREAVETRLLIGGRPLVDEAFGQGPGNPPGPLLGTGALRATTTGHEVQLAEAYCTEGCCGALYVTIRREGAEVVWDGWRGPHRGTPPPAYRFDAAAYDAELARAETDHARS
ncbi:hypothetical protein [Streptomyces sp. NPDC005805]|uniref:hypothetical protein n=1 Tax=Streptomyces sp. NPDC005805 TaxID=3157068 RepID=UPI0034097DE4